MSDGSEFDHIVAKGKLQSTHILETKWGEISISFIIDPPTSSRNINIVLVIVDKATKMVHLVPYWKIIIAIATVKLLWSTVVKLHGIPRVLYSDWDPSSLQIAGRNYGV